MHKYAYIIVNFKIICKKKIILSSFLTEGGFVWIIRNNTSYVRRKINICLQCSRSITDFTRQITFSNPYEYVNVVCIANTPSLD